MKQNMNQLGKKNILLDLEDLNMYQEDMLYMRFDLGNLGRNPSHKRHNLGSILIGENKYPLDKENMLLNQLHLCLEHRNRESKINIDYFQI